MAAIDEETTMSNSVKTYSTDQFTWTGREFTFSAEVSDLGVSPEGFAFGPLPSNSMATGLMLNNPKTGGYMEFQIIHVEFSRDNEILWWTLSQPHNDQSQFRPLRVVIYND